MAFKIDFFDDEVVEWHRTESGLETRSVADYAQTVYVDGPTALLRRLGSRLRPRSGVVDVGWDDWYTSLRASERDRVLAVDLDPAVDARRFAGDVRRDFELPGRAPGTLRFYNVDLAPQFRYCVETGTDPTPGGELSTLRVDLDERRLSDRDASGLALDGDAVGGSEAAALRALARRLGRDDPDVLVVGSGELVPLLAERAAARGVDLRLGRRPGWERLAGSNSFESYGRVGHSPARYDVPGRALVDVSSSFLWAESNLDGLLDLVERSRKPLQEVGWGSIGNVLTSIQIREALDRGVLVPWNKWEPEAFKDIRTLHAADRGGFTMDPEVGMHEDVYELDFSSLYPNIMCRYNVSPDTVLCDCHAGREDVPEIGYNVCDERGFLADVLQPLVDDRERLKRRLRESDDEAERRGLRARSGAIKWILVSCFGYQGYRNSKFGRIECHEAINAYARDIFLRSKAHLEDNGWRVVHGIVDSIWVTPAPGAERRPVEALVDEISADVGIKLDLEARYDWVCFVPRRGSAAGALTKYFAKEAGGGGFKIRGIEARQRSTPSFVADAQRDLLETLDRHRTPEAVVDRAERHVRRLRRGEVDPAELFASIRVSKRLESYSRRTLAVAALRRAKEAGVEKRPGQTVRFLVADDDARSAERVRLAFEDADGYDAEYYVERLLRATESVVSPLGWDRSAVDRYRRETVDAHLAAFE